MGQDLFENDTTFRQWMLKGNALVKEILNVELLKELYEKNYKKSDLFDQTLLTHPALFLVEYALAQVLLEKNIVPQLLLGTSLGEFVALALAGILSFEEALYAVAKQAEVLEKYCSKGGMLAILHPLNTFEENIFKDYIELAAINESHFIIFGLEQDLKYIEEVLIKKCLVYQKLAVSKAFHSHHVDIAKEAYLADIKHLTFKPANIPCLGCCQAQRNSIGYLWDVIRLPILFQTSMETLEQNGPYYYLDLGPSGALANFAKHNLKPGSLSKSFPVLTPFGSHLHQLIEN